MWSSGPALAAARSPRGSPKRATRCSCSRPAAILELPILPTTRSPRSIRSRRRTRRCGGISSSATTTDSAQQKRDPKFVSDHDGIWYPRAGTLGGCTAHNAMILVAPNNSDWDQIADLTGDPSWRAAEMWRYFQRIEDCRHRPFVAPAAPVRARSGADMAGRVGCRQKSLRRRKRSPTSRCAGHRPLGRATRSTSSARHRWPASRRSSIPTTGASSSATRSAPAMLPLTTDNHQRTGTRERLLAVAKTASRSAAHRAERARHARRVRRRESRDRRRRIRRGSGSMRRIPAPVQPAGEKRIVRARREVILAGGAFNTPQLLMLSGIGDPDVLGKCGIRTRVPLPGRRAQPAGPLRGAGRQSDGAALGDARGRDVHHGRSAVPRLGRRPPRRSTRPTATLLSVVQRSAVGKPVPDLFCYAVLADFRGYEPGYSECIRKRHDCLTWVVLKGHTNNRGGSVTITSPDPRATTARSTFATSRKAPTRPATICERSSMASSWPAG